MPSHPVHPEIRLLDGRWYQREPLEHYRWMREKAPLYWDPQAGLWGVSLHEDVMAVSRQPELFSSALGSRPEPGGNVPSMINMDDPAHKRRRNLVNRGFTPRRLAEHEVRIRTIVTDLIDAVEARGHCDFVREIAAPLPMIVIGDMLGVLPEDRDRLLRWSEDLLRSSGSDDPADLEASMRAAGDWAGYAREVIRDRRSRPLQDDLMSILVHSEIEGEELDDEALLHESLLILVGGDETTRHVITQGMEALIRHPEERRKLLLDPSKIALAVEEMLRWVSPIKNMNRTATRDVELRGQQVRRGDRLLLLYHSANRDERAFEEPDRFDVERSPNPHVAFGGYGTHHCLGASLARLELRVAFEELLRRLPDLEIEGEAPLPLRRNNFIVGIEEMPVVWNRRAKAPRPRAPGGG
jgi:cytochrome P450 family 142 subfamily A polypeptide 1